MAQNVRDVMTTDVVRINCDTTVKEAAEILRSKDIGSLPICEGNKVIGMITDRDIALRVVADDRDPGSTTVSEIMTKVVVSVREDADLQEAERLMQEYQLRRLPVLSGEGELVGYLSLARVARSDSAESSGKVLKGVSEPTRPAPQMRTKTG